MSFCLSPPVGISNTTSTVRVKKKSELISYSTMGWILREKKHVSNMTAQTLSELKHKHTV